MTDEESDEFPIARESKQGDPLSSLLFKSVLRFALEDDLRTWRERKGWGKIGSRPKTLHFKSEIR